MVSCFFLPLWITGENRAKLKKLFNFNSRLRWGAQYPRIHLILLSEIAIMQVIFWTEDNFSFISYCKKLINEQIIIFYNPSNVLCSSDESVQVKHFKHHTFSDLCSLFTWFNLKILSFCQWRHIIANIIANTYMIASTQITNP